jgi:hypothetical protein
MECMRIVSSILAFAVAVLADEKPEPAPVPLKSVPADGEQHLVACKGATYWIAIPKEIDPKKPARVLMWLHGSNMNGGDYVGSLKRLSTAKRRSSSGRTATGGCATGSTTSTTTPSLR